MEQQYILSAVGSNRTGVVAEVSEAVFTAGGNIENSFMTLLGEHFSLMLQVGLLAEDAPRKLQDQCEVLRRDKDLAVHLFPVQGEGIGRGTKASVLPQYDIRVQSEDRPGVVYRLSRLLASREINILQMSTRVEESFSDLTPHLSMRIQVEVPDEVDDRSLRRDLKDLAEELGNTITLTSRRD
ncbi:MAG: ACT domain-containing protein [Desulfohalobiaceae bacterium]